MNTLRIGSFCSGIAAPETAWLPLGWAPQFFSEIDPFASAVLAHRFPGVPNVGDMTAVDTTALPPCDVWVAGTPCQAFSVAGLRQSLSDDRGNLTLHFVRLIHAADPRIVVWENVPGVLSTKDNAFGCFLAGLVGEGQPLVCHDGSWPDAGMAVGPQRSAAWRVLDAQYLGLAQRRRRVFVVSFRTGDGANPGAVLFEPESLPRHSPPSREAGSRVAGTFVARAHGGGGFGTDFESDGGVTVGHLLAHPLLGKSNSSHADDPETYVTHSLRADGFEASEDGTGRGTPLVPVAIQEDNQNGVTIRDTAGSLRSDAPGTQPCGTLIGEPVAFQCHGSNVGPMGTVRAGNGNTAGGVPFVAALRTAQTSAKVGRPAEGEGQPVHDVEIGDAGQPGQGLQGERLRSSLSREWLLRAARAAGATREALSKARLLRKEVPGSMAVRRLTPV